MNRRDFLKSVSAVALVGLPAAKLPEPETVIYYVPADGAHIPLFDGEEWTQGGSWAVSGRYDSLHLNIDGARKLASYWTDEIEKVILREEAEGGAPVQDWFGRRDDAPELQIISHGQTMIWS